MNPVAPVYIVSKSRAKTMLTPKALDKIGVPYRVVVEEQQLEDYALYLPRERLLVLDPEYQRQYDTCDDLGDTKSKGPGPARNFVWEHSIAEGHAWHWVMDDNILNFHRFNRNLKTPVADGTIMRAAEVFCDRFENIGQAGFQYFMFIVSKVPPRSPYYLNTRIYSCILNRNDVDYRWRGRYNEDTDLSLRILKDGLCTVLFNAFLADKIRTQVIGGGNTEAFYAAEGTMPKSQMIVDLHPDVARLAFKFGRDHHHVDYSVFKQTLKRKDESEPLPEVDDFGMGLEVLENGEWIPRPDYWPRRHEGLRKPEIVEPPASDFTGKTIVEIDGVEIGPEHMLTPQEASDEQSEIVEALVPAASGPSWDERVDEALHSSAEPMDLLELIDAMEQNG